MATHLSFDVRFAGTQVGDQDGTDQIFTLFHKIHSQGARLKMVFRVVLFHKGKGHWDQGCKVTVLKSNKIQAATCNRTLA